MKKGVLTSVTNILFRINLSIDIKKNNDKLLLRMLN